MMEMSFNAHILVNPHLLFFPAMHENLPSAYFGI